MNSNSSDSAVTSAEVSESKHFIERLIENDCQKQPGFSVITRFPPEPNGYLHIGHAKSICLNFGMAEKFQGRCHLRMDDTNPEKEEVEYEDSIRRDVEWMGFQWHGNVRYASDYFPILYQLAEELIVAGHAYVCELSPEQVREYRGTLTQPGRASPFRTRTVEQNLERFRAMKAGEVKEGVAALRAKIDMASPNINLRDPVLYRVKFAHHHRTKDQWCIYPTYDYAHGISDAIEGITHSLCTLEFEDHRPLYDWILDQLPNNPAFLSRPRQTEFARLNLNYTLTSKRKLRRLVEENHVQAWNDPRMPTIAGLRRRGYTPTALRNFCESIGVARAESVVDMAMLEHSIRAQLDEEAPRRMCVMEPLLVELTNLDEHYSLEIEGQNHPKYPERGTRSMSLRRFIYIERSDFIENPPKKYHRLFPGAEVRLRHCFIIRCDEAMYDAAGHLIQLKCSVDKDTLGKNPTDRKVKGVIHWVDKQDAVPVEIRLYDRLFSQPNPDDVEAGKDFTDVLNPESLTVLKNCLVEPSLKTATLDERFQFERSGYFCRDSESKDLIFNRVVSLRDNWEKD